MRGWVYLFTFPNGKIYVGSTADQHGPSHRWLGGQGYRGQKIYSAIKKYGWKHIKKEILQECLAEHVIAFEQVYLDYFQPWMETSRGYNISKLAQSRKGTKQSREAVLKGIETRKRNGQTRSAESRKAIGDKHRGKIVSTATREKMRKSALKKHRDGKEKYHSHPKQQKKSGRPAKIISGVCPDTGIILHEFAGYEKARAAGFGMKETWKAVKDGHLYKGLLWSV